MVAFNLYLNDEETHVAGIQVHPDPQSMQRHTDVVRDYVKTAYGEFLEGSLHPARMWVRGRSAADGQATDTAGVFGLRIAAAHRQLQWSRRASTWGPVVESAGGAAVFGTGR
jgi:hypothetical protein